MSSIEQMSEERASVGNDLSAIFVSLELSLTTWLITSLSPGGGGKMSKHPQGPTPNPGQFSTQFNSLPSNFRGLTKKTPNLPNVGDARQRAPRLNFHPSRIDIARSSPGESRCAVSEGTGGSKYQ